MKGLFYKCNYQAKKDFPIQEITFMLELEDVDYIYLDHIKHVGGGYRRDAIAVLLNQIDCMFMSKIKITPVKEANDEAYNDRNYELGYSDHPSPLVYRGEKIPCFSVHIWKNHNKEDVVSFKTSWSDNLTPGCKSYLREKFQEFWVSLMTEENLKALKELYKGKVMSHLSKQIFEMHTFLIELESEFNKQCSENKISLG